MATGANDSCVVFMLDDDNPIMMVVVYRTALTLVQWPGYIRLMLRSIRTIKGYGIPNQLNIT